MLGGDDFSSCAVAALTALGLSHVIDFPARLLSAGQRRRVALARLLMAKRPLWLLDEPTTALDAAAQVALTAIMRAHLKGGGILVAAAHAPLGLDGAQELRLGSTSGSGVSCVCAKSSALVGPFGLPLPEGEG